MNTPETQTLEVPRVAPVMVLPNTLLFPDSLLPLFIFEERYRAMLAWALENDRMFCMALIRKGREDWSTTDDFHHIAGLGLIRASVAREDGTSHLILQGIARVRFTRFVQTEPFVIAEFRELPATGAAPEDAAALSAIVLKLCGQLRERGLDIPEALENQIAAAPDAGTLSDLVAHTLLRDPHRRQSVLEAADISTRLRTLISHLRDELSS
ncbi:MAG: LON peptidase substrate-binding domain-containing protein [Chthoniobacteraceae bacterium]